MVAAFRVPPRLVRDQAEPDDPHEAEVRSSLRDMRAVNRYCGGLRAIASHLLPLIQDLAGHPSGARAPSGGSPEARPLGPRPQEHAGIRLLDVGTGSADIPRAVVTWGRRRGIPIQVLAIERNLHAAQGAREASRTFPEIRVVRGDAFALPFREGSFHFVTASLMLHYFSEDRAADLLGRLAALASCAVLVNDLLRHWFPAQAIRLLARWSDSRLFREASRRSLLQGFSLPEVERLARAAGFPRWEIATHAPFRFCLVGFRR